MTRYLFCCIVILLWACKEDTKVNTIRGTLYQSCSQVLGGAELALKANETGSFSDPLILGSTITDGNGNYSIMYELEEEDRGTADIIMVKSSGFETLIANIELNTDVQLNIYRTNIAEVAVQLLGSKVYSLTDTLFYGLSTTNQEASIVQPTNGILNTFLDTVPNLVTGGTPSTLYYGLGSIEFNRSKAALTHPDSTFNLITISLEGCIKKDTATIIIN